MASLNHKSIAAIEDQVKSVSEGLNNFFKALIQGVGLESDNKSQRKPQITEQSARMTGLLQNASNTFEDLEKFDRQMRAEEQKKQGLAAASNPDDIFNPDKDIDPETKDNALGAASGMGGGMGS